MDVKICDAAMGIGKTSAAINYMNAHPEKRFIFVTPFLTEVDRVIDACAELDFTQPINKGDGKLHSLERLVIEHRNIASTHALFGAYTKETEELIKEVGYTLILDEVFDVIHQENISPIDVKFMLNNKLIDVDPETNLVRCANDQYISLGDVHLYKDIMKKSKTNRITLFEDSLLMWTFPSSIFESFDDVIILTYMFNKQIQYFYHKMYGCTFTDLYIKRDANGESQFTTDVVKYNNMKDVVDKIHILYDDKFNSIGSRKGSLSVSWYKNKISKKDKDTELVKNNTRNFFRSHEVSQKDAIWTVYQDYKNKVCPKGFLKSFVPCTSRATNEYSDRHYLGYLIDFYINPIVIRYFDSHGIKLNTDGVSLSTMLQWIFRSAIRNGEDIYVYVPSMRMRNLLQGWIDSVKDEN